ncbi:MAG TPA: DNA adenine methylase [Candidatus Angelobacter sp.]|jgi:DNA adenine methylase|nr:DNA adenine methylase [Candidatus Angelobacter sp.]
MTHFSPLRYPGGKQILGSVLAKIITENALEGSVYAESYAGGAGAALSLLYWEYVSKLYLNDADPCIYAVWRSVLDHTEDFCKRVRDIALSIDEWKRQKSIYANHADHNTLDVGFATFYLNRTNRSGIIKNGGPIGGYDQTGPWKIDARFGRKALIERIERIALYRERIAFTAFDAISFCKSLPPSPKLFFYLDPPYYVKGSELYLNHYKDSDHKELAAFLKARSSMNWVMTYDRVAEIEKLYKGFRRTRFSLSYSATKRKTGKELLIFSKSLRVPERWQKRLPKSAIHLGRMTRP